VSDLCFCEVGDSLHDSDDAIWASASVEVEGGVCIDGVEHLVPDLVAEVQEGVRCEVVIVWNYFVVKFAVLQYLFCLRWVGMVKERDSGAR
jgi:hypothetical protein